MRLAKPLGLLLLGSLLAGPATDGIATSADPHHGRAGDSLPDGFRAMATALPGGSRPLKLLDLGADGMLLSITVDPAEHGQSEESAPILHVARLDTEGNTLWRHKAGASRYPESSLLARVDERVIFARQFSRDGSAPYHWQLQQLDWRTGEPLGGEPLALRGHALKLDPEYQLLYLAHSSPEGNYRVRQLNLSGEERWQVETFNAGGGEPLLAVTEPGVAALVSVATPFGEPSRFRLVGWSREGVELGSVTTAVPVVGNTAFPGLANGLLHVTVYGPPVHGHRYFHWYQVDVESGHLQQAVKLPWSLRYRLTSKGSLLAWGRDSQRDYLAEFGSDGLALWESHFGQTDANTGLIVAADLAPDGAVAALDLRQEGGQLSSLTLIKGMPPPQRHWRAHCPPVAEDTLANLEAVLWHRFGISVHDKLSAEAETSGCHQATRHQYREFLRELRDSLALEKVRARGHVISVGVTDAEPGVLMTGGHLALLNTWYGPPTLNFRVHHNNAERLASILRKSVLPHADAVHHQLISLARHSGINLALEHGPGQPDAAMSTARSALDDIVRAALAVPAHRWPAGNAFANPTAAPWTLSDDSLILAPGTEGPRAQFENLSSLAGRLLIPYQQELVERQTANRQASLCAMIDRELDTASQLLRAVQCGDADILRKILAQDVRVRRGMLVSDSDYQPIHQVSVNPELVDLIIDAGFRPLAQTPAGDSALMLALARNDTAVAGKLLRIPGMAELRNHSGDTALHRAARQIQLPLPLVGEIMRLSANLDATNLDGETPLHLAVHDPILTRQLLRAGSSIHVRDAQGMTALHRAATTWGAAESIRALLEAGADPTAKDKYGNTALDLARDTLLALNVDALPQQEAIP